MRLLMSSFIELFFGIKKLFQCTWFYNQVRFLSLYHISMCHFLTILRNISPSCEFYHHHWSIFSPSCVKYHHHVGIFSPYCEIYQHNVDIFHHVKFITMMEYLSWYVSRGSNWFERLEYRTHDDMKSWYTMFRNSYDRSDSFPLDSEPNGILFGS